MKHISKSIIIVLVLSGCATEVVEDCDTLCTYTASCGWGNPGYDCLDACTTNSAHSSACAENYTQSLACTLSSDCTETRACFTAHKLKDKYLEAKCPR